jgi:site-specific DNA recombinase
MPAMIDPGRVAAYIRWSTDDQADGTTLEVQRESCIHYILSQGWRFREDLCFVDDGYSGGTLERPALAALRRMVGAGQVDCIVVYKLDRLSRSVVDTVNLVLREWEGRCHVKSTREPIDTASPAGKMFFYLLVSYAEWERSVIRERTMAGKQKRAEQGKNPGIRPPYGYACGGAPGEWAVCEGEAAVVRRIFREYATGRGLVAIAGGLNAEAVPTRSGAPWRASTVSYLLQNEAYRGVLAYGSHRAEKALPALIDEGLWQAVQAGRRERAALPRRSRGGPYLLSGVARCRCGAPLVGGLVGGRYRTYSCSARRAGGAGICGAGTIQAGPVEEAVLTAIRGHFAAGPASEGDFRRALAEQHQVALGTAEAWARKAAAAARRLERVHADYEAGRLPPELYQERLTFLRAEEATARAEADRAADRAGALAAGMQEEAGAPEATHNFPPLDPLDHMTPEETKALLREAIASLRLWMAGKERDGAGGRRLRQVVELDLTLRTGREVLTPDN